MKTICGSGKKRLSVTGRRLYVGSGIKSSVSPIARAICFSEDAELLPDNESVSESKQTRAQSSTVKRGGNKPKRAINLTRLCAAARRRTWRACRSLVSSF